METNPYEYDRSIAGVCRPGGQAIYAAASACSAGAGPGFTGSRHGAEAKAYAESARAGTGSQHEAMARRRLIRRLRRSEWAGRVSPCWHDGYRQFERPDEPDNRLIIFIK